MNGESNASGGLDFLYKKNESNDESYHHKEESANGMSMSKYGGFMLKQNKPTAVPSYGQPAPVGKPTFKDR